MEMYVCIVVAEDICSGGNFILGLHPEQLYVKFQGPEELIITIPLCSYFQQYTANDGFRPNT